MIFSPPKGRPRKNVHTLSRSSSEGDSPLDKKSKFDNDTNDKETHKTLKHREHINTKDIEIMRI